MELCDVCLLTPALMAYSMRTWAAPQEHLVYFRQLQERSQDFRLVSCRRLALALGKLKSHSNCSNYLKQTKICRSCYFIFYLNNIWKIIIKIKYRILNSTCFTRLQIIWTTLCYYCTINLGIKMNRVYILYHILRSSSSWNRPDLQ